MPTTVIMESMAPIKIKIRIKIKMIEKATPARGADPGAHVVIRSREEFEAYTAYNDGVNAERRGDLEDAARAYRAALGLKGDLLEAVNNLGGILKREGDLSAAQTRYEELLRGAQSADRPDLVAAAQNNLGLVALAKATHGAENAPLDPHAIRNVAIPYYLAAMEGDASLVDAQYNLANAYQLLGEDGLAYSHFVQVLQRDPAHVRANMNLGNLFIKLNRFEDAAIYHARAASATMTRGESAQTQVDTINNLGQTLREAGDLYGALAQHERALAIDPGSRAAAVQRIVALRALCAWRDWDKTHVRLSRAIARDARDNAQISREADAFPPYDGLLFPPSLMQCSLAPAEVARRVVRTMPRARPELFRETEFGDSAGTNAPRGKRPLRLGYMSYDMNDHPMGFLMHGLYAQHDRDLVNVSVYMYGPRNDAWQRLRVARAADRFVDVAGLASDLIADRLSNDGIDILVDLMAHTRGARVDIAALSRTPAYVNFLGFPGTSGFSGPNAFVVADTKVLPVEHIRTEFTERPIYLPGTYQANDYNRTVRLCQSFLENERGRTRCQSATDLDAEVGIALGADAAPRAGPLQRPRPVRFANFNTLHKLEPASFEIWMRVLRRVPYSVMLFVAPRPRPGVNITANLRAQAAARGVQPDRLIFLSRADKNAHLDRLTSVDLFLDSLVYGAHSTAADVLWAGVPLLTVRGSLFPGRVATSLLTALGMHEVLAADSVKDFEDVAVDLATHPYRLDAVRARLGAALVDRDAFDPQQFSRGFEQAMRAAIELSSETSSAPSSKQKGPVFVVRHGADQSHLASQRRANLLREGSMLHHLDPPQAAAAYRRALASCLESGELAQAAEASHLLGVLEADLELIRIAVNAARSAGAPTSLFLANLAHVERQHAQLEFARADFRHALDAALDEDNRLRNFADILNAAVHLSFVAAPNQAAQDARLVADRVKQYLELRPALDAQEEAQLLTSMDTMVDYFTQRNLDLALAAEIKQQSASLVSEASPARFRRLYDTGAILSAAQRHAEALALHTSTVAAEHAAQFRARPELRGPTDPRRRRIAFYCHEYGQTWWPHWGPRSPQTNGVGGSEEAVIFLARELADLGYAVEIYADPLEQDMGREEAHNVYWLPHTAYDTGDPADIFVAWRYHISLALGQTAAVRLLWLHDVVSALGPQIAIQQAQGAVGAVLAGSRFHVSSMPLEVQRATHVVGYGLQAGYFEDGSNSNHEFIYASAPNRGLEQLLRVWPQIRAAVPAAKLRIYYGFSPSFMRWGASSLPNFHTWVQALNATIRALRSDGVEYVGMVPHRDLARAYAKAGFSLYPTSFPETGCVSMMKAMAMGAIPITSRFENSSLPDLTGPWDLGPPARAPGAATIDCDEAFLQEYASTVIATVARPVASLARHRADMVEWARRELLWSAIARRFETARAEAERTAA